MSHWIQQKAIKDKAPGARCRHLQALHRVQAVDAISRTKADETGRAILQRDVPDREQIDCEPFKDEDGAWEGHAEPSRVLGWLSHALPGPAEALPGPPRP